MAKAPKIEYTPEMQAAQRELGAIVYSLDQLARKAGCKSLKIKVVQGKGGSTEIEYRREWDKEAPPYAEPTVKPAVQPLARPTV